MPLETWPEAMASFFGPGDRQTGYSRAARLRAVTAVGPDTPAAGGAGEVIEAELAWAPPDRPTAARILDLWDRMMDPDRRGAAAWHDLRAVLDPACVPAPRTSVVIPTPHSEAALAFTLERGRAVLDALAGEGARLAHRAAARPLAALPAGRPWLGGEPTRLAALSGGASDAAGWLPLDGEEAWLAPYRAATAAALAGERPDRLWPEPAAFARAALGSGALEAIVDRVLAAHHCATKDGCDLPPCSTHEQQLDAARRRLGALMALPTLQRLFGLAADVLVRLDRLPPSRFLLLAPATDDTVWTLARAEPGRFVPAAKAELAADPPPGGVPRSWAGLTDLGQPGHHGQRYDVCTLDTVLAAEADITRQVTESAAAEQGARIRAGGPPPSPVAAAAAGKPQALRNGGLRLLDRDVLLAACGSGGAAAPLAACTRGRRVDDADVLAAGGRLLIGLRVGGKVAWRCPQFREVRFSDPASRDDWVERELTRRSLPAGSARRLQLDAATLTQAAKILAEDTPTAPLADDPALDDAIKTTDKVRRLVAESTVAAWSGEPMGVPPAEDDQGRSEHRVHVVDELDISRRFAAPAAPASGDMLAPLLRFGWPYHVALACVFDGGGSATLAEAAAVVGERPSLALPATASDGMDAVGRRYLRHERLDAPMSIFPDAHWLALEAASPAGRRAHPASQRGADMVVRSARDPVVRLGATRRLLLPPPVPLQFAALHDVVDPRAAPVPQGLHGMTLLDKAGDDVPARLRFGGAGPGRSRTPYYPDPAARMLAISLHQRDGDGAGRAFGEPLVLQVATGAWPEAMPVDLELVAVPAGEAGPMLVHLGLGSLVSGERVVAGPGRAAVQRVQIRLRPGEDVAVKAWFLPGAAELSRWFDAVEAAGLLAVAEGVPIDHADAADACARGLDRLLGQRPPGSKDPTSVPAPACTGAAGLVAPPARMRLLLAGRVQAALQATPIPALTAPLTFRATHATDRSLVPAPRIETLAVVRRRFPGGDKPGAAAGPESRLDFLNAKADAKWAESDCERDATGGLFAGTVSFDPATVGALELQVSCAAPLSEALDPELGRTPAQRRAGVWPDTVDPT